MQHLHRSPVKKTCTCPFFRVNFKSSLSKKSSDFRKCHQVWAFQTTKVDIADWLYNTLIIAVRLYTNPAGNTHYNSSILYGTCINEHFHVNMLPGQWKLLGKRYVHHGIMIQHLSKCHFISSNVNSSQASCLLNKHKDKK